MNDDFSDWGSYDSAAPTTSGKGEDPFADWSNAEDLKASKSTNEGMGFGDVVRNVAAGVAGDTAAAATGAQVLAERSGFPSVARGAQAVSTSLHKAERSIEEGMSPAAKQARDAALLPGEGQEQLGSHPLREATMKGSSVAAPAAVGAVGGVLGGMLAGPPGAAAGAAGAGALYGLAKGVDQAVAWTNELSDDQLEKEAPVFGQFKKMYLEEGMSPEDASYQARASLHEGLYGFKQAAWDAGTNAVMFGAGRKVLTGAIGGNRLAEYVLTGTSMGAASAGSEANRQTVEGVKKGEEGEADLGKLAVAFLNGTAEGVLFHGAGEGAHKLAKWAGFGAPKSGEAKDQAAQKEAVGVPTAGGGASTGAAPKTAMSSTQPPPNVPAQAGEVGNTVNPPKRDQQPATDKEAAVGAKGAAVKQTAKKRSEKGVEGSITLLDESAPLPLDQQQALNQSTPGPADQTQLVEPKPPMSEQAAQVAQPPVTPEVTAEAPPEVPPPAAETPEAPATLDAQIQDLVGKKRDYVRFATPDDVPDEVPAGVQEHEASDGSVWWYRGKKESATKAKLIEGHIAAKTENEILPGLGPDNKPAVAEAVAQGETPAAAVTRTPEGVEKAAAATTVERAPETLESVRQDAAPGDTVALEQPEAVIAEREAAQPISEAPNADEVASAAPLDVGQRPADGAPLGGAYAEGQEAPAKGRQKAQGKAEGQVTPKGKGRQKAEEIKAKKAEAKAPEPKEPVFDEALAREEARRDIEQEGARTAPDGRRILPTVTDAEIEARVAEKRKNFEEEQRIQREHAERIARLDAEDEEERKQAAQSAASEPADFTSQKNPGRVAKKIKNRADSNKLFDETERLTSDLSHQDILKRAQDVVAEAERRGISIVRKLDYEKNSAAQAFLKEAKLLLSLARDAAKKNQPLSAEEYRRFVESEFDLRDGPEGYARYKATRRAEGDARNSVKLDETRGKSDRQKAESDDEAPTAAADAFTGDDLENEANPESIAERVRRGLDDDEAPTDQPPPGRERPSIFKMLRKKGSAEKLAALRDRLAKVNALAERGATRGERQAAANRLRRLQERFGEELKASEVTGEDFVTKGSDKAGTFQVQKRPKVELSAAERAKAISALRSKKATPEVTERTSKPSFEDDLLAAIDATGGERDSGERPGYVSFGTGREAASAPIRRTTSVRAMFDKEIRPTGMGPLMRALFPLIRDRLRTVAGDVEVHFVTAEDMKAISNDPRHAGFYKPDWQGEGGYIVLSESIPASRLAHIFTHEALHAATTDAIYDRPNLARMVKDIMSAVEKVRPELKKEYGFTNEHEFIAEAFSNERFQTALNEIEIPKALARELGMQEFRRNTLWARMVDVVRQALRLPEGSYSALEALMRPTELLMWQRDPKSQRAYMENYARNERRPQAFIEREDVEREGRKFLTNLGEATRKVKRAVQTSTLIRRSTERLGKRFEAYTRRADDVFKRMTADRNEILERDGGVDLVRRGADLAAAKPEALARASDIANRAVELRVDPTKDAAWHEKHLGKDATKGWQGKAHLDALRKEWAELKSEHPDVAGYIEDAAKFGSRALDMQTRDTLKDVLDEAGLYTPKLVDDLMKSGKVPDADRALFESETLINHVERVAKAAKRAGWYFPALREGEVVVRARREFDVPTDPHVTRIDTGDDGPAVIQFTDPTGGRSELKARRAARDFVVNHKAKPIAGEKDYLPHTDTEKVWVDRNNPTQELDASDPNAVPAFRITLMDRYMSKHATEGEAREVYDELRKAGWSDVKHPERQRLNPNARWGGFVPSQYEALISSLRGSDRFRNATPADRAALLAAMHETNLKLLPGMRLQHTKLRRENVAGYSKDIADAVANFVRMDAGYRARLRYAPELKAALDNMRDYIASRNDKFNVQRGEIYHELESRYYSGQEFEQPTMLGKALSISNKISMVTKLFGASQPIMNSMEVGTVAAPLLGARHGYVRAARALSDAYKAIGARSVFGAGIADTMKALRTDHGFTDYREFITQNILNSGIEGPRAFRLIDLVDYLHDMNLFGHEAGMEVQRLTTAPSANPVMRVIDRADIMFRQINQAVEAVNRAATGVAAYELEYRRNGNNHFAAVKHAHDVVHDSMGDYSAANASPMFNSTLGKTALQFKKYGQKTYALVGRLFAGTLRRDPEATKAFIGIMATHAAVAGLLGVPGVELIKAAFGTSGLLGGPNWDDFQFGARDALESLFGPDIGKALARGFPRLLGVDLAGRMGAENLVTPMDNPKNPRDITRWLGDVLAGAPGSLPRQGFEATAAMFGGDWSKVVESGPFKALRDAYRAVHGYASGYQDVNGRTKNAPLSLPEAVTTAVGFTPGRIAEEREYANRVNEQTASQNSNRRKMINKWLNADPDGKAEARAAITKYNETVPPSGRITAKDLVAAVNRRKTEQRKGTYDRGARITKQNRGIVERARETYGF